MHQRSHIVWAPRRATHVAAALPCRTLPRVSLLSDFIRPRRPPHAYDPQRRPILRAGDAGSN